MDSKYNHKLQSRLQQLLTALQLDDAPAGGAVMVWQYGQPLASAQVGQARLGQAWSVDTLALNFSTGKGVLVTLIHVLVSQNLLDYDIPIANYWSQFGCHGKEEITLRQVLSHQAGLFDITSVTTNSLDMLNWQNMIEKVALMQPSQADAKEAQSAYSALISGWVLGGLIEQVCQMPLNQALRQYLTEPLGIADAVYFGVPQAKLNQVAQLSKSFESSDAYDTQHRSTKPKLKADSEQRLAQYQALPSYRCWQAYIDKDEQHIPQASDKALTTLQINKLYFDVAHLSKSDYKKSLVANTREPLDYYHPDSLMAQIPAANGVASARALATIYAMLAQGGVWQGKTLIDAQTLQKLAEIEVGGADAVMPSATVVYDGVYSKPSMQWRLGYHRLFSVCHEVSQGFGHMGYNGSVAWCEPSRGLALSFVHNFDTTMLTDIRQFAITEAVLQWVDEMDELTASV
ncbi:serine hydrolase domain-containing protein [Psychrobacter sp. I-STPA6b]|uniref:serine hydrolase domain-containing protein n=1 Tax=Psychrobacter sp. I-STPA6b TaxID=2585718 RepID=UPI001D0C5D69|nr:serine hydrolase domain-containing protein [Psychrobacter sp. I-STPA6b]